MGKLRISIEIDPQYNRKTNPNKKGEYPIHILLRKVRQKASIIPDIPNIALDQFKKGSGNWVKKSHPHAKKINLKLSQLVNLLESFILDHDARRLNPKEVKEWYLKNHSDTGDFKDFRSEKFHSYFEKHFKKSFSTSTHNQYKSALNKLQEFKTNVCFFDFNRGFVEEFSRFLGSHEKIIGSSGAKYFTKIKTIYKKWYAENYPDDPAGYLRLFSMVSVKQAKPKPNRGFTKSELDSLIALDLSLDPVLELVRDLTVFMCYSSRYLKELMSLTFENVKIDPYDDKKILIWGYRSKTGIRFENPIFMGIQMDIFQKYHPAKKGKLFPQIYELGLDNHDKFIYFLRKITTMIGMGEDFKPGVKIGKVTFKSLIGVNFNSFTRTIMMGHSNSSTQEKYNSAYYDLFELTKGKI